MVTLEEQLAVLDSLEAAAEKKQKKEGSIKEVVIEKLERKKRTDKETDSLKGTFLVYMAKENDDIIYIGSGVHGREQRCISGCSHVYGLNERHFKGSNVVVTVVKRFKSKEDSLDYEKQLICLHRPILNIKGNPDAALDYNVNARTNWDKYFCTLGYEKRKRYVELLDEMLDYYGIKALTSKGGVSLKGYRRASRVPSKIFSLIESYRRPIPKEKYKEMYELTGVESGYISLPANPPEYTPVEWVKPIKHSWSSPPKSKTKPRWLISLEGKFPDDIEPCKENVVENTADTA